MKNLPGFTAEASLVKSSRAYAGRGGYAARGGEVTPAALDCTNLPSGVYANPEDCTTFYKCSNGYSYLYSCPSNLLFDEPTLQCEWPELARCAGGA